jgi:glycosyltransferase involved in cell wall biosynthesis
MSRLTIIQVAFPFAPVGPDAVGGAEQVLTQLEAGLTRLGHRCITIACEGSQSLGPLIATPLPRDGNPIDEAARARVDAAHRQGIAQALRQGADLVHLHGVDAADYLPPPGVPALVTLHLPPAWYPPESFSPDRPDTWLNAVSWSQHRACPKVPALLPPVQNGVPVEALGSTRVTRRRYALALGRICAEKNLHEALDAGTRAGVPVLLGGEVFPYAEHERYWREEIAPRLKQGPHRFLGPLGFARKRRLLSGALCLLSASLAPETSSLVTMEALACGTPVVAFPSGALPEIVEHGVTGFLVRDVAEMAEAIRAVPGIDAEACRAAARRRFSAEAMVEGYLALYRRILRARSTHAAVA